MPFIENSQNRILFVHIPKTGGTSIEKALEEQGPLHLCSRAIPEFLRVPPEHLTLQNIDTLFAEGYFSFIFTVVRNPYTRLESEYRMRSILARERFFKDLPAFPLWLEQMMEKVSRDRSYLANHFRPQIEFVGKGVYVFKYEDGLETIVAKIGNQTGLRLRLPGSRFLSSQHADIPIQWSDQSVRLVNKFYAEDFDAFNYQKRSMQFKQV